MLIVGGATWSLIASAVNIASIPPAAPTINIFNQDPKCDLDYAANQTKEMKINHAISNSFGFGGTNGSIVLSKID